VEAHWRSVAQQAAGRWVLVKSGLSTLRRRRWASGVCSPAWFDNLGVSHETVKHPRAVARLRHRAARARMAAAGHESGADQRTLR